MWNMRLIYRGVSETKKIYLPGETGNRWMNLGFVIGRISPLSMVGSRRNLHVQITIALWGLVLNDQVVELK